MTFHFAILLFKEDERGQHWIDCVVCTATGGSAGYCWHWSTYNAETKPRLVHKGLIYSLTSVIKNIQGVWLRLFSVAERVYVLWTPEFMEILNYEVGVTLTFNTSLEKPKNSIQSKGQEINYCIKIREKIIHSINKKYSKTVVC